MSNFTNNNVGDIKLGIKGSNVNSNSFSNIIETKIQNDIASSGSVEVEKVFFSDIVPYSYDADVIEARMKLEELQIKYEYTDDPIEKQRLKLQIEEQTKLLEKLEELKNYYADAEQERIDIINNIKD